MIFPKACCSFLWIYLLTGACFSVLTCYANQASTLVVDASDSSERPIPDTLFGIFFEVGVLMSQTRGLFKFLNRVSFHSCCYIILKLVSFYGEIVPKYLNFDSAGDQSCWCWWIVGRACEQQRSILSISSKIFFHMISPKILMKSK